MECRSLSRWSRIEFLSPNELEIACDMLELYAQRQTLGREFWIALRDAAAKMELSGHADTIALQVGIGHSSRTHTGNSIGARFDGSSVKLRSLALCWCNFMLAGQKGLTSPSCSSFSIAIAR